MTGAGEHVEPLPARRAGADRRPAGRRARRAGEVYRAFDAHATPRTAEELEPPPAGIRAGGEFEHVNDLEGPARRALPRDRPRARSALRAAGVEHPMVTGSGPTVFGFSDDPDAVARLHAAGYPRAVAA